MRSRVAHRVLISEVCPVVALREVVLWVAECPVAVATWVAECVVVWAEVRKVEAPVNSSEGLSRWGVVNNLLWV
jgi:hypothetical protein